jgi:hypothetical protein
VSEVNGRLIQLEDIKAGTPMKARQVQKIKDAVEGLVTGIKPPRQKIPRAAAEAVKTTQQFQIESIEGDYLVCNPYDGTTAVATQIKVAKPKLLRRSTTSHNGITYTYTSDSEREASDGSDTETQVIVPAYTIGDVIFAVTNIEGDTGVVADEQYVEWQDMNVDARAWSKEAE